MAEIWSWRRELHIAQAQLAGMPEAQAEASAPKVTWMWLISVLMLYPIQKNALTS